MATREEVIRDYLQVSFKGHPKLENPGSFHMLKYCVENIYGRKHALFCIDVEAWERDMKKITEIGISIFDPRNQENAIVPSLQTFHLRPRENLRFKNGRFVPNNATYFSGTASYILSMEDSITFLKKLIEKYFFNADIPCCLVGHDLKGDVKWLKSLGIDFPEHNPNIDTQLLMSFLTQQKRSLTHSLSLIGIPHANLHNAGNDAYYTLLLALKISDPQVRLLYRLDKDYPLELVHGKHKKGACPQVEIEVDDVTDIIRKLEMGYMY